MSETAEVLESYPPGFEAAIGSLVAELVATRPAYLDADPPEDEDLVADPWRERPDFAGLGSQGHVFKIQNEGQTLAVKYFHRPEDMPPQLEAFKLARALPGLVQLSGYSLRDGVLVMDYAENETGDRPVGCSDDQIADLIRTVIDMRARGLGGELSDSNILYSRDEGFKITDYELLDEDEADLPLEHRVRELGGALFIAVYGTGYSLDEYMELSDQLDQRVETIASERFPEVFIPE